MRRAHRVALAVALMLPGCARQVEVDNPVRMAQLKKTNAELHERFEKAAAKEALIASAFADRGQIVVAMRAGLIEDLVGDVARRYLDYVAIDLEDVKAHSSGEVRKKTFLGRVKIGAWTVRVELGNLVGDLRAGNPTVTLRPPNLIGLEIPIDVQETTGQAMLHFGWDSAGLANVFCKDFEVIQGIRGRVLAQHHVLSGALRVENKGESLTATPLFPDRSVRLRLDLGPRSWDAVLAALRAQDTSGTCGALLNPEQGLAFLKGMAAKGVVVRLPRSIFRTVHLPARLQQSVMVNDRPVGLSVKAESLRIDHATLWSSASIEVQANPVNELDLGPPRPKQKVSFTRPK